MERWPNTHWGLQDPCWDFHGDICEGQDSAGTGINQRYQKEEMPDQIHKQLSRSLGRYRPITRQHGKKVTGNAGSQYLLFS